MSDNQEKLNRDVMAIKAKLEKKGIVCAVCETLLPANCFNKETFGYGGYANICKGCKAKGHREVNKFGKTLKQRYKEKQEILERHICRLSTAVLRCITDAKFRKMLEEDIDEEGFETINQLIETYEKKGIL